MSDELKKCPFCGGDAEVMIESSYYMVGCKNEQCGAGGLWHVERDKAVAAWNRRDQERTAAAWPKARVIKTEAEYEAALAYVDTLMEAELDSPEEEQLELFALLVEDYEKRHYPTIALPARWPTGEQAAEELAEALYGCAEDIWTRKHDIRAAAAVLARLAQPAPNAEGGE